MNWLEQNINSIVLGDCYDLIKKIPDNSVDCIYTDIPYLYDKYGKPKSEIGKRITKQHMDQMSEIISGIYLSILGEFTRIMKKVNCFIWCSRLQIPEILNYFINKGCNFDLLVWCKTNPMPLANNSWLSDIEYCLYFRDKGVRLNDGIDLKSKWFISSANKNDKELYKHPTIKPFDLVKRHLLHATQENDIVFDPFSCSGTTCVASKEINRNYLGIEIDNGYHKISDDRLNGINASGQTSIFTDFKNL